MAWTKAKTALCVGGGVLLVAGIITMVLWPGNRQQRAQATGERLIEKQIAKPVDLAANYTSRGSSAGPSGFYVLNNVPLQIDGVMHLWGEGGGGMGAEKILDIPVNQRFQTLYVYHGSYYGSPPGTPVCEVVFRYADGSSVTNRLLYGVDILDWFAPGGKTVKGPTGPNSRVAWIGQKAGRDGGTQQLRYCMTAIENPEPILTVSSIDLYSCKSRTVAYIMAMTTGKSGLMNDATPIDDREK